MVPTKAIIAAAFVAGAGGTSVYFLQPKAAEVVQDAMPEWRSVENSQEQYSNTFGADYRKLLAGASTAASGKNPTSNDAWWNWVFKTRYEPNKNEAQGGFKGITRGAKGSESSGNSLEGACHNAFNSESSKVKNGNLSSGSEADSEFKEDQLWKFCSPLGQKPKTLANVESVDGEDKTKLDTTSGAWNNKVGGGHKNDLLAIYHSDNVKVWELLDKVFKASNTTTGFFSSTSVTNIKEKCASAYALDNSLSTSSSSDKPSETELYTWCSLKGKKAS